MYWKLLKNGCWEVKEWERAKGGVEWTKVKYTYSGDTLRNTFEYWLNIKQIKILIYQKTKKKPKWAIVAKYMQKMLLFFLYSHK
jgi:hypothetical protein